MISRSPADVRPVFEFIVASAARLCEAEFTAVARFDSALLHLVAINNLSPEETAAFHALFPRLPARNFAMGRAFLDGRPVQFEDVLAEPDYDARTREVLQSIAQYRSFLGVPILSEGKPIGVIGCARRVVKPFTDGQIGLLNTFAEQATIALENVRLFNELEVRNREVNEALEQQTATAEVLEVINSSPGDLAPVFDAILEKAHSLCGVARGSLELYDGENFRAVATHGLADGFAEQLRRGYPASANPATRPLIEGHPFAHILDRTQHEFPFTRSAVAGIAGTLLAVPLRKEERLLGAIFASRQEVRPFSDKQVALLQNFAAQAVIAMENARLLTETREALEQQTATAEVLQVINSSPGDLTPVFEAMLEKAMRLCEAAFGGLWTFDEDRYVAVALRGVPAAYAAFLGENSQMPGPGSPPHRFLRGERSVIHNLNLADEEPYRAGDPQRRALVDLGGARTALQVPLVKDDAVLGVITVYRQEVRPFSDKQIALLQNFAAQAVIAMENARLITETREALEQQTATAEVLQVINSSPGDLTPVFDAMLEKAMRLCGAAFGQLHTYDGEGFPTAALRGLPAAYAEYQAKNPPTYGPGTAPWRIVHGEHVVHLVDLANSEAYRAGDAARRATVDLGGCLTLLTVALRREGTLLGTVSLYRQEVRPFSEKQIALLQNFAAQAVIAMENARLLGELHARTDDLQESLEYQTAISDVLKVISRSAFDLQTVLQTVVTTAVRLCRANSATIYRNEGGEYCWAAGHMLSPEYEEIERAVRIRPGTGTVVGRAVLEQRTVQLLDAWTDPLYEARDDARVGGVRTMIGVPLLRENAPIGVIGLARRRVEAFSEREIALVTTFADQAVIAIENARLIDELRDRTAELGRSVEELKMLGEVGRAVSSTLDLRAVLSTILTASLRVTMANAGAVFRYTRAERAFRLVEAAGWDEALRRSVGDLRVSEVQTAMGEATARRMPVQIADLAARMSAPLRDAALAAGFRSALIVPLVGAERVFGAITLMRHEVGEFPPETVRLMQTLASQSVLAIQNARLFREIADKSEQLALASQHKSQFLANMSHELRTPLNAILGYAELLVDGIYGVLPEKAQGVLERVQNNGKHLLALINDVLDLAKIEAGQLTLTLEDYALAEVVHSVVTATEPLAAAKGLKFTTIVQDGMPMAHGDARRVSQVLLNLAGNAIKFTDAGEVEINASAANGQFVLTVRDTGPGIADADQERILANSSRSTIPTRAKRAEPASAWRSLSAWSRSRAA